MTESNEKYDKNPISLKEHNGTINKKITAKVKNNFCER